MSDRRFAAENDTPCPFRMARFGYKQTGEFRIPKSGEQYIVPATPPLREDEPQIALQTDDDLPETSARHIVVPISAEDRQEMAHNPFLSLLEMLLERHEGKEEAS